MVLLNDGVFKKYIEESLLGKAIGRAKRRSRFDRRILLKCDIKK
jgi:hypothetical protein